MLFIYNASSHLSSEHIQRAQDYHEGGSAYLSQEAQSEHPLSSLAWWPRHHILVHWFHSKAVEYTVFESVIRMDYLIAHNSVLECAMQLKQAPINFYDGPTKKTE